MLEAALEAEFTLDEDEGLEEAVPATGPVGWPCPRQEELRFAGQLSGAMHDVNCSILTLPMIEW